jgi:hypothetical protein
LQLFPAPTADRIAQNARQQLSLMANVAVILLATADAWSIAFYGAFKINDRDCYDIAVDLFKSIVFCLNGSR